MSQHDSMPEDVRAILAQRLSRLLLASDEPALERFRRQHLAGAPHATLDDLRLARELLEHVAHQLHAGDADGWGRLAAARVALARDEETGADEDMGVTMVRPQRLDRPAPGPAGAGPTRAGTDGPAFFHALSPDVQAPKPSQTHTMTVAHQLVDHSRTVDRALNWSIDEWAGLCVELEEWPHDTDAIWARRGVEGERSVRAAIQASWETRLRDRETKRTFDAAVARHRFFRITQRHNG